MECLILQKKQMNLFSMQHFVQLISYHQESATQQPNFQTCSRIPKCLTPGPWASAAGWAISLSLGFRPRSFLCSSSRENLVPLIMVPLPKEPERASTVLKALHPSLPSMQTSNFAWRAITSDHKKEKRGTWNAVYALYKGHQRTGIPRDLLHFVPYKRRWVQVGPKQRSMGRKFSLA